MQQTQINQTNRMQQTPTPPPQSHQQSAPLLAQLQTPTSSSQVNSTHDLNLPKSNKLYNVIGWFPVIFGRRWAYDCTPTSDYH